MEFPSCNIEFMLDGFPMQVFQRMSEIVASPSIILYLCTSVPHAPVTLIRFTLLYKSIWTCAIWTFIAM